jgi:hypothetical protein
MNSMAIGGYKSADFMHLRGGYQKPFASLHQFLITKMAIMLGQTRYLDFKKDVDPNVHVRMFNFAIKTNIEIYEEYIINMFSYTLRGTSSN